MARRDGERRLQINFACNRALGQELEERNENERTACHRVTLPVLVVHGSEDPRPLDGIEALVEALPDARLEVVPGAGHQPWTEQPQPFTGLVRRFLSRCAAQLSVRPEPTSLDGLLERARVRRQQALELAADLKLVERWSRVGQVQQVGAVAYGLVVSRDLDYEVFTDGTPSIAAGFEALAQLAHHPRVTSTRFRNALHTPDQGLYWQVRCTGNDTHEWKVDLWTLAADHPGPLSAWLVEPMRRAVNDEQRKAILLLKEARAPGAVRAIASIDIYRAVIDGGVRTPDELGRYLGPDYEPRLTA